MKKFLTSLLIVAVLMVGLGAGPAQAGAYETAFTTSITYQNIGTATANSVALLFYESPTDPTPTVVGRDPLAQGAGTSVYIGSINDLASGFRGTAVMTSDQPMAATLVQVPASTLVKARPLSNGFSGGSPRSLIATFFKDPAINSILSVQNAGSADTTVTLKFYNVGSTSPDYTINQALKQGAGYYVDGGTTGLIGTAFNGSVVIETAGGTGSIVSSVVELNTGAKYGAKAFEGVGQGATTFYMPSATCTATGARTFYAVQNTSTTLSANVQVTYKPGNYTQSATILPGNKTSFSTCAAAGMPQPYSGAAVVESTNGTPIIAIGKVDGGGQATAFTGFSSGATKIAMPYVRWAANNEWLNNSWQRTYIAIQNVGADIPAGTNITVKYINSNGTVAGTHTFSTGLAQYLKFNSNATNAGLTTFGYTGGVSGGGVIIEGPPGSQLVAVARVQTYVSPTNLPGEDYNGIPMP